MPSKLRTLLLLSQAPTGAPPPPGIIPPIPPGTPAAPPPGIIPPIAPGTPAAPPPVPGEIAPGEAPEAPRVDITSTYPQVNLIRIMGIVFLFLSIGFAVAFNHLLLVGDSTGISSSLGYLFAGIGAFTGLNAFRDEDWRKWFSYISAFAILACVASRPIVSPLVTYDVMYVLWGALFAFFFFLYMEYLDAYQRFTDVGRMAIERQLPNFNLAQVINSFLTRGLFLAVIFMVVALMLLSFVTQGFAALFGENLGKSVEMTSVFGQAMVIALVFTLVGVVFVFLFMILERKTDVEQVAYSREQIREMVDRGQHPAAPLGPSGPAGPGAGGPRGTSPGFVQRP